MKHTEMCAYLELSLESFSNFENQSILVTLSKGQSNLAGWYFKANWNGVNSDSFRRGESLSEETSL